MILRHYGNMLTLTNHGRIQQIQLITIIFYTCFNKDDNLTFDFGNNVVIDVSNVDAICC